DARTDAERKVNRPEHQGVETGLSIKRSRGQRVPPVGCATFAGDGPADSCGRPVLVTGSSSRLRVRLKVSARCRAASYSGRRWIAAQRSRTFPLTAQSAGKHWKAFLPRWTQNGRSAAPG